MNHNMLKNVRQVCIEYNVNKLLKYKFVMQIKVIIKIHGDTLI